MIKYAISTSSIGYPISEEYIPALRKSKFRNYELTFRTSILTEEERKKYTVVRNLVKEGVMNISSIHMPFENGTDWDASYPDEEIRKKIVQNHIDLLKEYSDIAGKFVTIHASGEPPLEEHPARMLMIKRTLDELMPIAEELDLTFNIEYLPRTCLGNCVEELQEIIKDFDEKRVGICLDVNHIMNEYQKLPSIIKTLGNRINSFHICDYDGVDETHWIPGQGVYDWDEILTCIRQLNKEVLLILETTIQLNRKTRFVDPYFILRQNERACFFMENYKRLSLEAENFVIPQ
jgi:sugar phosphate isomerase/epimerase